MIHIALPVVYALFLGIESQEISGHGSSLGPIIRLGFCLNCDLNFAEFPEARVIVGALPQS